MKLWERPFGITQYERQIFWWGEKIPMINERRVLKHAKTILDSNWDAFRKINYWVLPIRREWLLQSVCNMFIMVQSNKYSIKKRKRHLFICFVICENRESHENNCSQTSVFTPKGENNTKDKVN